MTTSPDGCLLTVHDRLAEIGMRYGPGHVVTRSIGRSSPALVTAAARVQLRMRERGGTSTPRAVRLALA
jgi:hypothetical protein